MSTTSEQANSLMASTIKDEHLNYRKRTMNEKKSKDKPKEETMPFTLATQKRILATVLFDKKALEDIHNLKPRYFENPILRDMADIIINFTKKYPRMMPDTDELLEGLNSFIESKGKHLPALKEDYLDTFEEILSLRNTHLEYSKDLFLKFIRFQAFKEAILESGQKLLGKFDFEGIVKRVNEAYVVGGGSGVLKLREKDLSKMPEKVEFLDKTDNRGYGRFAKGGVTIIAGRGGAGKGAFTAGSVGAAVTVGGDFEGKKLEQGLFLLFDEEDFEPTVKNRILNNRGDLKNFKWLELGEGSEDSDDYYSPVFSLKEHIPLLWEQLKRYPKEMLTNSLLLIDPLGTFMGMKRGSDVYNDIEVRSVLAPLNIIARKYNMAIILIAHFNKNRTSELISAVLGSTGFVNFSRAVYAVLEDEEERERHHFIPLKWNTPEIKNTGIEFNIEEGTDKITIVKELSAEDVAALKAERQPGETRSMFKREQARLFLEEELRMGGKRPKDLEKMAKELDICGHDTLYVVMREMKKKGITAATKDGFGHPIWVLIDSPTEMGKSSEDLKGKVEKIKEKHQTSSEEEGNKGGQKDE